MSFPCPPMTDAELASHTDLISRMRTISNRERKLISSSEYNAPAQPDIKIRSWKANEFKYYQVPSPFPTLARGVFSEWLPAHEGQKEGTEGGNWRIVCRGYDKFFNIGETGWTTWKSLETHTVAPYHLTLKSNGCIIFVGALTEDKLLVTSKHSLGPLQGLVSHASVGEQWLDRHLKSVGKTQADFAATLWEKNWTAVFELCDDSFEEHVLPIANDKTGLHLHGINYSQPGFATMPPDFVQQFAKQWGFIETDYITLNSIDEVHKFTDECAKTGSWNGEAIEGFVVRTTVAPGQSQKQAANEDARRSSPPYPDGSALFFKVKFDEPYMMYRDFREITKQLLSARGASSKALQNKLRRKETRVYRDWVEAEIRRDRKQFDGFTNNHGIIATRNRFFEWLETPVGQAALGKESDASASGSAKIVKREGSPSSALKPGQKQCWVIVPVAVPGSGKTAIGVALSHIFGFGHTQSDDVKAKKPAPVFLSNVSREFGSHDVVFADKNNHLRQHRDGLKNQLANIRPRVKLLALHWPVANLPPATIHRICADRVTERGDNHQALVPATDDSRPHEAILWRFIEDTEPLEEDEVDAIIEMDLQEPFDEALARAIDGICDIIGLEKPSQEKIGEATGLALGYQPKSKGAPLGGDAGNSGKTLSAKDKKALKPPRYYAFLPEADFAGLTERLGLKEGAPQSLKDLWESALKAKDVLIVDRPHVTIVHEKGIGEPAEKAVWDVCAELAPSATFRMTFDRIVFDGRVVAAVVTGLRAQDEDAAAGTLVEAIPEFIQRRFHVTIARREKAVAPVEGKFLVEKWRKDPASVDSMEFDEPIELVARMKGLVA